MSWFDIGAAGIGAAGGALGWIGQNEREKRSVRNQKDLNLYGQKLGMKNWHETNYGAQVDEMNKAGLNPSLMYGSAGQGGSTQAASGGAAPQPQPFDIGAMEGLLAQSTIELNKSQAEKNLAEADSTRGGEGTTGASEIVKNQAAALNLTEGAKSEKDKRNLMRAQTSLTDWNAEVANYSFADVVASAKWEARRTKAQYRKAAVEANVAEETQNSQVKQIDANVVMTITDAKLKESGIVLNETKSRQLAAEISQEWEKIGQGQQKLWDDDDLRAMKTRLGEEGLSIEWFKSLTGVIGSVLGGAKPTPKKIGY